MPTLSLGQVRPHPRGAWSDVVADYKGYDWVTFDGSAWLATRDVPINHQPDISPGFWALFGAQGHVGPQGPQGPQGPLPPLSDAIDRTDIDVAANCRAVKTAYDAAQTAQAAAAAAQTTANAALALLPRGCVIMWSGLIDQIPPGWSLCDGTNGAPDLRDKFVMGVGSIFASGATGGAETHTHTLSGGVEVTTLNTSQMPRHSHLFNAYGQTGWEKYSLYGRSSQGAAFGTDETHATGGGHLGLTQAHTHSLNATLAAAPALPPYLALAYIMKL